MKMVITIRDVLFVFGLSFTLLYPVGSISAQSYIGKTAIIETIATPGNSRFQQRFYFSKNALLQSAPGTPSFGLICPYKGKESSKQVCTKSNVKSCGGIFKQFSSTSNINLELIDSCSSKIRKNKVCYKYQHNQKFHDASVGKGTSTTKDDVCITLNDSGGCSLQGRRSTRSNSGSFKFNYRSANCKIVNGRRL